MKRSRFQSHIRSTFSLLIVYGILHVGMPSVLFSQIHDNSIGFSTFYTNYFPISQISNEAYQVPNSNSALGGTFFIERKVGKRTFHAGVGANLRIQDLLIGNDQIVQVREEFTAISLLVFHRFSGSGSAEISFGSGLGFDVLNLQNFTAKPNNPLPVSYTMSKDKGDIIKLKMLIHPRIRFPIYADKGLALLAGFQLGIDMFNLKSPRIATDKYYGYFSFSAGIGVAYDFNLP